VEWIQTAWIAGMMTFKATFRTDSAFLRVVAYLLSIKPFLCLIILLSHPLKHDTRV